MKKAFTLVELIGVVVILAIISLLAFPSILNSIRTAKGELSEANKQLIYNEANRYIAENEESYKKTNGNVFCLQLRDLAKQGYIDQKVYNGDIDDSVTLDRYVKVSVIDDKYNLEIQNTCEPVLSNIYYKAKALVYNNDVCKTDGTTYQYMGGCYVKNGASEELQNHVWYNGLLWRIMGINSNGTVRLITEENVTSIPYDDTSSTFAGSNVDSWLNDYFYNKLSNKNQLREIIVIGTFCQGAATTNEPSRTNCTGGTSLSKYVGLISMDEYMLAGGGNSYLSNGQTFRTMTPYNSSYSWAANVFAFDPGVYRVYHMYGIRPVINVTSDAIITSGNGTLNDYFVLNESKFDTRVTETFTNAKIGEYVNFNGKNYRVVENGSTTKLILNGFYQATEGTNYTTSYGDDNVFTPNDRITTEGDTLIGVGYTLNHDVLNWLTAGANQDKLKSVIVTSNWYQNLFDSGQSYSISLNETSPHRTISAQVGLIRIGEMFSAHSYGMNLTASYWTLTPDTESNRAVVMQGDDNASNIFSVQSSFALRPVISIDNNLVTITSGNGTPNSPYVVTVK